MTFFAFLTGGVTENICLGPAWTSTTNRGMGIGTTQLQLVQGIWTNLQTFTNTCWNGTSSFSLSSNQGTYLGSVYMTGNASTSMQFKPTPANGGNANVLGVYNAYNRVKTTARSIDTNANWTYSTSAWRAMDGSGVNSGDNNRIYFLDGLQQSFVEAQNQVVVNTSASTVAGVVGVELDNTAASPGGATGISFNPFQTSVLGFDHFTPQYGFHYVSAVEWASGSTVSFATDSGTTQDLKVELDM